MQIFSYLGSILGYLLWFDFEIFKNYGMAIIVFTIIIYLIQLPFFLKQQKSTIGMAKIQKKAKEVQEKYKNDRVKAAEEQQKLYDKEGVKPTGGCLTMIVPMLIMFALFWSVAYPVTNTLHINSEHVKEATQFIQEVPGNSAKSGMGAMYSELDLVKNYNELKPYLTMFTEDEHKKLEEFSQGFQFLGMDLLETPTSSGNFFGSLFKSNLFILPLLSLIFQLLSQFVMNRMQPGMQQQQGCMKFMMYGMSVWMAYIAAVVPAAMGVYWVLSSLINIIKTILMNKFYSPVIITAKIEAQHYARMELDEGEKKQLPADVQKRLEEKLDKKIAEVKTKKAKKLEDKNNTQKQNTSKNVKNNDDYLGKKK